MAAEERESNRAQSVPVIRLDPLDPQTRDLWRQALALLRELPGDWTLVGGLMVQLHAARYGVAGSRLTIDIDVLANSRRRPSATERVAKKLLQLGFEISDPMVDPPTAFRLERDGTVVDVLAPEKTGRRNPPKSAGGFQTIEIPGGTQALVRSETVVVSLDDETVQVRCPTLLGAILLKARAIRTKQRVQDRDDLVVLLSCVDEPLDLRSQLQGGESSWLRAAEAPLGLDEVDLRDRFDPAQLERARAAFRILSQ